MTLTPFNSDVLAMPGLAHGFFGRRGGISGGVYDSLNCGPGSADHSFNVIENRACVQRHFGVGSGDLVTPYQVHSPKVAIVHAPWNRVRPEADALVTKSPGLALSILTADCGPILFCDPEAKVIAAAHAGWKGALGGILEETIDAMIGLGAARERISAVLGPTISVANYEVGPEFYERFVDDLSSNALYFTPSLNEGHMMFDLPQFIMDRLERAAIGPIANLGQCTYQDRLAFFSYRRSTHAREADCGRNISVIMLEAL